MSKKKISLQKLQLTHSISIQRADVVVARLYNFISEISCLNLGQANDYPNGSLNLARREQG
jgi:hypothetical protein